MRNKILVSLVVIALLFSIGFLSLKVVTAISKGTDLKVTYKNVLKMLNQCTLYTYPHAVDIDCNKICKDLSDHKICVQAYGFSENNVTMPYQCNYRGGMEPGITLICNCCRPFDGADTTK